jgi:hypothetical protein
MQPSSNYGCAGPGNAMRSTRLYRDGKPDGLKNSMDPDRTRSWTES